MNRREAVKALAVGMAGVALVGALPSAAPAIPAAVGRDPGRWMAGLQVGDEVWLKQILDNTGEEIVFPARIVHRTDSFPVVRLRARGEHEGSVLDLEWLVSAA